MSPYWPTQESELRLPLLASLPSERIAYRFSVGGEPLDWHTSVQWVWIGGLARRFSFFCCQVEGAPASRADGCCCLSSPSLGTWLSILTGHFSGFCLGVTMFSGCSDCSGYFLQPLGEDWVCSRELSSGASQLLPLLLLQFSFLIQNGTCHISCGFWCQLSAVGLAFLWLVIWLHWSSVLKKSTRMFGSLLSPYPVF